MTNRKRLPDSFDDIEKPHPLVAEPRGDDEPALPLTVRLGDLWSDFRRAADERADPSASPRSASAVPLLDDMKGILQWD
jgi:hypothetical protein